MSSPIASPAWGQPPVTGGIRVNPEDFRVVESLGFEATGEGEHLWLEIEKTGRNTQEVATDLARVAGLSSRDVSYAGLKDRNAITVQNFSLHLGLAGKLDPDSIELPGVRVLSARRSARKIRRGRLAGNRFELTVRDVKGDLEALESRLQTISREGVPNGFGEQRFGGNNIARAYRLFRGELRRKPGKAKRGFYLSAARSLVFNQVLNARIREGTWNRLIAGDWVMLDGSHSGFAADPEDADLVRRCRELDLHPTGPLPGQDPSPATGEAGRIEAAVLSEYEELVEGLARFRLETQRRALRMRVSEMEWDWPETDVLRLSFSLGQGSFATSVLREIVDYHGQALGQDGVGPQLEA